MRVQTCSQHAKFILMTEEKNTHEIHALEAIEAVSRRGLRRYRVLSGGIIALIIIGFSVFWYLPAKQAKFPVALMHPKLDGAVGANAKRQRAGFDWAFKENLVDPEDQFIFEYQYPIKDGRQELIDKFEEFYKKGVRIFIMTMSGGVKEVKSEFIIWASEKRDIDRPVLVATVASAPDISDKENGVFRYYVRSEEESNVLSTYIESSEAKKVYVFYVDDPYGRNASQNLKTRLQGPSTILIPVKLTDGRSEIWETMFEKEIPASTPNDEKEVAVIIGYGSMIANTLLQLKDREELCELPCERPRREMLVVSTYTEREWRPVFSSSDKAFVNRIHAIGLGEPDPQVDNRGVVFQFSFLALDRALKCGKKHGVDEFWACWTDPDFEVSPIGENWAQVEFTSTGDSIVSLRILNSDELR